MKSFLYATKKYLLLIGLIVLMGFQYSCTDQSSLQGDLSTATIEESNVPTTTFEYGFTYPNSFVEKSIDAGLGRPNLMPDYKGPGEELYDRFKTLDHFVFRFDGVAVEQEELQNIDRSDIKAYRVIDRSKDDTEFQLDVDLYTHEGYMELADNWVEQLKSFTNFEVGKG